MFDINDISYRANPYPHFKKMREHAPLCRSKPYGYWCAARYTDVKMILKQADLFSSASVFKKEDEEGELFLLNSRSLLGMDGEEHLTWRRVLRFAFTPAYIGTFEEKIRNICQALITQMTQKKKMDFIADFAVPLPILVIAELLGLEAENKDIFRQWIIILLTWRQHKWSANTQAMIEKMYAYFQEVITAKRRCAQTDLISNLIRVNKQNITNKDIMGLMRLLLVAGTDTTTHLIGNAMRVLIEHPNVLSALIKNNNKIPHFIEETLRYDGPTISLSRRATADTIIAGIKINKNDIIFPLLASANHDEGVFVHPEQFDLERTTPHLALGTGAHFCLGLQLLKLQTRIAFEELFKVFQTFSRMDAEPLCYVNSFFFRGLKNLYISMT